VEGSAVGITLGWRVGASVGTAVGTGDGTTLGFGLGTAVVGVAVGCGTQLQAPIAEVNPTGQTKHPNAPVSGWYEPIGQRPQTGAVGGKLPGSMVFTSTL